MLTHSTSDFDFDYWRKLAIDDPQGFFRERERAIGAFIDQHPSAREELLALQSQIDGLRAAAGTPTRALAGIASLMADHLNALASHLTDLGQHSVSLRKTLSNTR